MLTMFKRIPTKQFKDFPALPGKLGEPVKKILLKPNGELLLASDKQILLQKPSGESQMVYDANGSYDQLFLLDEQHFARYFLAQNGLRYFKVFSFNDHQNEILQTPYSRGICSQIMAAAYLRDRTLVTGSEFNAGLFSGVELVMPNDPFSPRRLINTESSSVLMLHVLSTGAFVTGYGNGSVIMHKEPTRLDASPTVVLKGHRAGVLSCVELPGGKLATGSADQTINFWDLETGVWEDSINCSRAVTGLEYSNGVLHVASENGDIHECKLAELVVTPHLKALFSQKVDVQPPAGNSTFKSRY